MLIMFVCIHWHTKLPSGARAVIMMTDDCHFLFVGDSNDHRAKSFKMNLSAKLTPELMCRLLIFLIRISWPDG